MKSLMHLVKEVLSDIEDLCCVRTTRDFETISRRVDHEGMSFLTISLPSFCRDFESCLALERVSSTSFLGYAKNGALPRFLGGLLELVFDRKTGLIQACPSTAAIFSIRQVCLMFKKFEAECTPSRVRKAIEGFALTEVQLTECVDDLPEYKLEFLSTCSKVLFSPILDRLDAELSESVESLIPKHGPGTTSSGHRGNAKYEWLTWTDRLQQHFPAGDFLIPSWNDNRLHELVCLRPGQEPPVKVITVPKTLKTPRIIAVEPVHMQYVQQALLEKLVPLLESRIMCDSIGFTNQGISQELARKGSRDGSLATLDLSEASDRVAMVVVEAMLAPWPTLLELVRACRSTTANVPGFGVIPLTKFASMGSALCFPIESMVFLSILFMATFKSSITPTPWKARSAFLRSVRVYGDDIVLPIDCTQSAVCELEAFGLRVNQHKSFSTGKFRESCGGDYFAGEAVNPTYFHTNIPASRLHVREVEATVAARNLFYQAGLWRTAKYLDECITTFAPFPVVAPTSPLLGRFSYLGYESQKMCEHLHRPKAFGMTPKRVKPVSKLDGYGALMKHFLKRGSEPFFDKDHLSAEGRPKVAAINLRWAYSC
jgi:hypothetical protein